MVNVVLRVLNHDSEEEDMALALPQGWRNDFGGGGD